MNCQVLGDESVLYYVLREDGLEEKCAVNAKGIQEALRDAYMLSAGSKEETRMYLRANIEKSFADFYHQISVLPGDTANGLETSYSAHVYMNNESGASVEDAARALREMLTANPVNGSPSERWLAVITSLMRTFGRESIDTKIALESRTRVGETVADIVCEIKGKTAWKNNGFGFHDTEDMSLETVVREIRANIALMEEKIHQEDNGQFWGPISSIRFWYRTHGIGWGIIVTFLYGKHTRISAQSDEIVVETRMGNTMMTNRVRPVPESFAFTRESWERALRTAVSVSNADITGVMEHLRIIFPGLWKK